tara:strand:- start:495 stop:779 length:285 start_codon:yes stop_codon:yes gene_type:complete
MDTNTKTFLDYMEHSNGGSITYVAEKITQDYEKLHGVIEEATARQVVTTVEKLIIDHASKGSKGFEMGKHVNIGVVQLPPVTVWLKGFSGQIIV